MAAEHVFLDTSLLVAASVEEHPKYAASKTYVEGLAVERTPTCITPQICREFMAVLTRAAIGPRSFSVEEALTGDYFDYFDFFKWESQCFTSVCG